MTELGFPSAKVRRDNRGDIVVNFDDESKALHSVLFSPEGARALLDELNRVMGALVLGAEEPPRCLRGSEQAFRAGRKAISMMRIRRSLLEDTKVVMRGEYPYMITPLLDGIPSVSPALSNAIEFLVAEHVNALSGDLDRLVTMESMGIPMTIAASMRLRIPYSIIRKRRYRLPGEVALAYQTGYSEGSLYINGLKEGDRVVVLDNVYSTGRTMDAVLRALRSMGVVVVGALVLVNKSASPLPEGVESLVNLSVTKEGVTLR